MCSLWSPRTSIYTEVKGDRNPASVPRKTLNPHRPYHSLLISQKFHLVPSINAVSGSQELQWMVQPHFLGPTGYPRPLAYPQYSPPQPRPGVIRALGPPPGVRRRPCEQVRNRDVALSIGRRGPTRQGQDLATREFLFRREVPGRPRKR